MSNNRHRSRFFCLLTLSSYLSYLHVKNLFVSFGVTLILKIGFWVSSSPYLGVTLESLSEGSFPLTMYFWCPEPPTHLVIPSVARTSPFLFRLSPSFPLFPNLKCPVIRYHSLKRKSYSLYPSVTPQVSCSFSYGPNIIFSYWICQYNTPLTSVSGYVFPVNPQVILLSTTIYTGHLSSTVLF